MYLVLLSTVAIATAFVWLGSPISPYANLKMMFPRNYMLLPFTFIGIALYGFSIWTWLTRNSITMTKMQIDWETNGVPKDDSFKNWKPHHLRLHTKLMNANRDYSPAYPYDKEAAEEMLNRHEKEMEEVRLQLFGAPVGVWKKESITDKVNRLNKEGVECHEVQ